MPRLMNARQERFAREFIVDLIGSAAYVRAGYAKGGANAGAARLLANVSVKARIAELSAKVEKKIFDDAAELRTNLRSMANFRITDLVDADGHILEPPDL